MGDPRYCVSDHIGVVIEVRDALFGTEFGNENYPHTSGWNFTMSDLTPSAKSKKVKFGNISSPWHPILISFYIYCIINRMEWIDYSDHRLRGRNQSVFWK